MGFNSGFKGLIPRFGWSVTGSIPG